MSFFEMQPATNRGFLGRLMLSASASLGSPVPGIIPLQDHSFVRTWAMMGRSKLGASPSGCNWTHWISRSTVGFELLYAGIHFLLRFFKPLLIADPAPDTTSAFMRSAKRRFDWGQSIWIPPSSIDFSNPWSISQTLWPDNSCRGEGLQMILTQRHNSINNFQWLRKTALCKKTA